MEYQEWFEYATFDEDGVVNGISPNAPDKIKKSYDDYLKEQKEANREGIRL